MKGKYLVTVVGPTAIGKTKLAVKLANYFKTEIISADSRQFYKEMSIGTAVPSSRDLESVPHHFIQHKSIHEDYNVGDFEKDALRVLNQLFAKKDYVIMVGGSGLYVDAVIYGLDTFPEIDKEIRFKLNMRHKDEGLEVLQNQLKTLDPEYYAKADIQNPRRVLRALEICLSTGKTYSSFLNKTKPKRSFNSIIVGITADREILYDRINQRVDRMMKNGLLEEARALYKFKDLNALQTVGYKELFDYFEGIQDLDFAISEIKKNTRRYAKRQLTWYRKSASILWVNYSDPHDSILNKITKLKDTL
ncbi:tRNA (adenosine(37)-N6)-dimethylallyltransferase MiaA [uncultured Eudoraea sp.]|uniref:tRNA (adenosine(37)-N6)-dimethylallyltransferase MiaA n=1 Tax=uncultured Eudoraea sp. TaxID=1035614 RepID=UPI00263116A6|nr:tRNA (adenosine(37)-N6)-dimethylallyltransferase MiaA [uncultured Eudoraea sp.]